MNGHSRFQYTLDNPMLTLEQRQFYEDNGFLVIPRLVSSQFLDACKERFLALCDRRVPWGGITMMKDISLAKNNTVSGERLYNKAQDFVYDEVLFQFCLLPQVSNCFPFLLFHIINPTILIFRFWTMLNALLDPIFALCIPC
jgi:phytanoyl-CoA hydroxylase